MGEWPQEWSWPAPAGDEPAPEQTPSPPGDGERLATVLQLHAQPHGATALDAPPAPAPVRLPVLLAGVALLLAWAATSLVDGLPGPLDGLALAAAAASPFALVAAIPLAALALRGRHWVVAVPAAVAGLVPWLFLLPYAAPSGSAPAAGAGVRLSAMLLDADGGRADAPSLVAAVARQPVDLLVVTGATGPLAHDLTEAGLDPRLVPRWASAPAQAAGTVVWSRYPVTRVEPLAGVSTPAVRLVLDTGRRPLTVVVGTASTAAGTGRWRADLAGLGAAASVPGPVALLGDLDATPQQAAFRRLTGRGLADAADALGRGARPTWPSWSPLPFLAVDHVLVGGGVGVRAATTLPVAGTAHRALVTSLVVPDS